jgi:hypothetical protein
MGKLLSGHYGNPPEAESMEISLRDCHQKLGLKPSDLVSQGPPKFFEKNYGSMSRYLLVLLDERETAENAMWKPGYYLLPLEAKDVLDALAGRRPPPSQGRMLPITIQSKKDAPSDILVAAKRWAEGSQPLFFKCGCDHLELKLEPPWAMRRRWRVRLRCPKRCQPALSTLI